MPEKTINLQKNIPETEKSSQIEQIQNIAPDDLVFDQENFSNIAKILTRLVNSKSALDFEKKRPVALNILYKDVATNKKAINNIIKLINKLLSASGDDAEKHNELLQSIQQHVNKIPQLYAIKNALKKTGNTIKLPACAIKKTATSNTGCKIDYTPDVDFKIKSSRRLSIIWTAVLSHHRTCRSAYGGSVT